MIIVNGHSYDIKVVVFDKDGLLFESKQLWYELARERVSVITTEYPQVPIGVLKQWMSFVGIIYKESNGILEIEEVDPMGVLAIASVTEEIYSTAAFLVWSMGINWIEGREMAIHIFKRSDALLNLSKALRPKRGFPEIFRRLRAKNIAYGIATSDTYKRTEESISLFEDFSEIKFVITSEDVKQGKPNKDMLELIQRKMNVPMKKIAMIGDSYVDVEMAKRAGAIGIGIPETKEMKEKMEGYSAEIITSLAEIQIQ